MITNNYSCVTTSNFNESNFNEVKSCSDFILDVLSKCNETRLASAARFEIASRQKADDEPTSGSGIYEVSFGSGTPVVVSALVEAESADDAAIVLNYELKRHMQSGGLIEMRPVDDRVASIGIRIAPNRAQVRIVLPNQVIDLEN